MAKAEIYYQQILRENSNSRAASICWRCSDALASLDRALTSAPNNLEAEYSRGNVLREMGRSRYALGSFERVLASRPDVAEAW